MYKLAAQEGWTVNSFYLTHVDYDLLWKTVAGQLGDLQPDTLYVFLDAEELRYQDYPLHYYRLDGILVGTVDPLPLPEAALPDPPAYEFVPAEIFSADEGSATAALPDGALQLISGGIYGPECDLWPGTYEVVLEGSGFDQSYVYSGWHVINTPFNQLDIVWIEGGAKRLVFRLWLNQVARGWSVNVHTLSDTPITVDRVTVTRID